jgi:hypothetical protein
MQWKKVQLPDILSPLEDDGIEFLPSVGFERDKTPAVYG